MTLLELDGLTKNYGALRVTDEVSLSLRAGEALGIIGPNGAGKTTLFNLVAGNVKPDSGRVTFEGRDITALPARLRCRAGIARSFQVPNPFGGLTVFENVLVGAHFGGGYAAAPARDSALRALRATGLRAKADVEASRLTLLERKRLEMARALATTPTLLLLDEIAGGLTEPECAELIAAITDIRKAGVTIIWIEHVVHALLAVVDRIAVLDFGRLIADGLPREVMASEEVARVYLGLDPDAALG